MGHLAEKVSVLNAGYIVTIKLSSPILLEFNSLDGKTNLKKINHTLLTIKIVIGVPWWPNG